MKKKLSKERGVSPVIATVLLISMVIVIALIIFLWFIRISGETITKFGENVELVCGKVEFTSSYDSSTGNLYISNTGNVPIFGMKVKIQTDGSQKTYDMKNDIAPSDWPSLGLNQGGIFSASISSYTSGANKIILIPVLIGTSDKGERTYMCNENQYGYEVPM
jgi:flagellin-like protein